MIKRFLERHLTYPQYKQILCSNFIKKNIHTRKPQQSSKSFQMLGLRKGLPYGECLPGHFPKKFFPQYSKIELR
jgi:hypothetical protein